MSIAAVLRQDREPGVPVIELDRFVARLAAGLNPAFIVGCRHLLRLDDVARNKQHVLQLADLVAGLVEAFVAILGEGRFHGHDQEQQHEPPDHDPSDRPVDEKDREQEHRRPQEVEDGHQRTRVEEAAKAVHFIQAACRLAAHSW